jgi:hypothetical protein
MQLVPGDTMEEAWPLLTEEERDDICQQSKDIVGTLPVLCQKSEPPYIGEQ